MTTREAADLIESLATRDAQGWHTSIDPAHVATDYWRTGALSGWHGHAVAGTPDMSIERLGLIPWWQVERLIMHQMSSRPHRAAAGTGASAGGFK